MSVEKKPKGRPPGRLFPRRLLVYEDDEGMTLRQELARRRGCSLAALDRMLIREEAVRAGMAPSAVANGTELTALETAAPRPLWERIIQAGQTIPDDERKRLPADSSVNLDHYLYGAPKRQP